MSYSFPFLSNFQKGDLSYFEAVNKETLKNAYQRFKEEGIIALSENRDSKMPATIKLSPEWVPSRDENGGIRPQGRLWDYIETIAKSRREGKNRRDGQTVSTRVLALADKIGRELHSGATERGLASGLKAEAASLEKHRQARVQTGARL